MTYEHGDLCYTIEGVQVEYLSQLDDKHLVREVLYADNNPESEPVGYGHIQEVLHVYSEPPLTRRHERVTALDEQIVKLGAEVQALREEKAKLENSVNATKASCVKHAAIQHVVDAIEGKITHFVVQRWNGVGIMTRDEGLKAEDADREFAGRKMRLLTLYGDSKGNLMWNLNRWYDGSGSETYVYPCFSMEEARITAQRLIDELAKSDKRRDRELAVESAVQHRLVPPADIQAEMAAEAIKSAEANVRAAEATLAEKKDALVALMCR